MPAKRSCASSHDQGGVVKTQPKGTLDRARCQERGLPAEPSLSASSYGRSYSTSVEFAHEAFAQDAFAQEAELQEALDQDALDHEAELQDALDHEALDHEALFHEASDVALEYQSEASNS